MCCGHTLGVLDLVPVLSYALLGGKCRYCASHISLQYPLIEAAAAALAVLLYLRNPDPVACALGLAVWLTLLFVVVYDAKHQIIPWSALGVLTALAVLQLFLQGADLLAVVAGPLLAAPLLLLSLVSRGTWMGWGDGMLELSLGWLLGFTAGLTALVFAFWTGAIVGIILMLLSSLRPASPKTSRRGGYTMKSEVPFAPFLIAGAACAYFLHVDIFQALPALFL